jgi:alpha/beta superfamily hydrolase
VVGWVGVLNTALSAVSGAAIVVMYGFTWGGWVSTEAATRLAQETAEQAVAASLTPYCVAQSKDASAEKIIAELKITFERNRPGVIENAGWATPIGATEPSTPLARACALAIVADWPQTN